MQGLWGLLLAKLVTLDCHAALAMTMGWGQ